MKMRVQTMVTMDAVASDKGSRSQPKLRQALAHRNPGQADAEWPVAQLLAAGGEPSEQQWQRDDHAADDAQDGDPGRQAPVARQRRK